MQWQPAPPPGRVVRPLGLGEILDGGFQVLKRNLGPLVRISALFVVPVQILTILLNLSILPEKQTVRFGDFSQTSYVQTHSAGTVLLVTFFLFFLAHTLRLIAAGAITRLVSEDYLGHQVDAQQSLRFALARFWPLLGLSLLVLFGVGLGFVACFIPGIYLWVAWTVATPALVVEGASPPEALSRSMHLVNPRWWPVLGYTIVVGLLVAIPGLVVTIPAQMLVSRNTVAGVVLSGVLGGIVSLFTTPFAAATIVLLYFDLRVRREAFDITLMANALDLPAPAVPQPGYAPPPPPPPPPPAPWGTVAPPPPPEWGSPPAQ